MTPILAAYHLILEDFKAYKVIFFSITLDLDIRQCKVNKISLSLYCAELFLIQLQYCVMR